MKRERIGQVVFLCAVAVAAALYGLTAPEGLPWNESVRLAAAYCGGSGPLGDRPLPYPIWGFHVQAFGGAVSLAILMAALAAGLLGALVNRHFGWRFAASAAIVWIFLPSVWNRAITGERGVCVAAMIVVAAWAANAAGLWAVRKMRAIKNAGGGRGATALPGVAHEVHEKYAKVNRIAGWAAMGAAGIFAVVSLSMHDYMLGEAASVFARGVVEAAGERIIVANGVCDEQIERELKLKVEVEERNCSTSSDKKVNHHSSTSTQNFNCILLRNDEAYRVQLVEWVKREWPNETNLWVAAQVSAQAFVELALKKHSDRFYRMNGKTTTLEQWEKRWEDFKPYVKSSDRFVAVGRRLLGYEGNVLANAMLDEVEKRGGGGQRNGSSLEEGDIRCPPNFSTSTFSPSSAWRLYKRIYEEIDPGNIAALINMSEMIRRGFAVGGMEKKTVQERLDAFFNDAARRKHAREIVRAAGPVRADAAMMEKMAAEAKKRIAERIAAGEKVEVSPEVMSLVEWNGEMCQLMDRGDIVKAGRIARKILSNPKWHGFIPANAAMGVLAASEGDYVASEAFFRVATDTTNAVPAMVLNDYADTLMNLGKLDEAESMARRAVKGSGEKNWLTRLTLAQVLEKKAGKLRLVEVVENGEKAERYVKPEGAEKMEAEAKELLKSVMRHAPEPTRTRIRNEHKGLVR